MMQEIETNLKYKLTMQETKNIDDCVLHQYLSIRSHNLMGHDEGIVPTWKK